MGPLVQESRTSPQKELEGPNMKATGIYFGAVLLTVGIVLSACEDADEIEITGPALEEVLAATQTRPDGSLDIRIGGSRFDERMEPLVLIDGVPVQEWWVARGVPYPDGPRGHPDLDPRVIEKITVFKGAKAVELYGPDAGGGVVLITLKDSIQRREGSG